MEAHSDKGPTPTLLSTGSVKALTPFFQLKSTWVQLGCWYNLLKGGHLSNPSMAVSLLPASRFPNK